MTPRFPHYILGQIAIKVMVTYKSQKLPSGSRSLIKVKKAAGPGVCGTWLVQLIWLYTIEDYMKGWGKQAHLSVLCCAAKLGVTGHNLAVSKFHFSVWHPGLRRVTVGVGANSSCCVIEQKRQDAAAGISSERGARGSEEVHRARRMCPYCPPLLEFL